MNATEKPMHIQQAEGLRAVADMIEQNPELSGLLRQSLDYMCTYASTVDEIAAFIRAALRHGAEIVKEYPDAENPDRAFRAYANFGPVSVVAITEREKVCERVVTGTEVVTTIVPDPTLLAEVPQIEVTETVEISEWKCKPLLAAEVSS